MTNEIMIDKEQISEFCRKHNINKLALFGSILGDNFRDESDIDVLVEFEPGMEPGLFALAAMERELSLMLGRSADLRTPEDLSRLFRDDVVSSAEVLYAA